MVEWLEPLGIGLASFSKPPAPGSCHHHFRNVFPDDQTIANRLIFTKQTLSVAGLGLGPENKSTQNPERGTALSFPFIELYGIELLEVVILNITVKCERCKEATEIKGLKNGITKSESCRKCASPLGITFRRDLVHAHAVRAGFLDLEGCIAGDMLPRYAFRYLSFYNY